MCHNYGMTENKLYTWIKENNVCIVAFAEELQVSRSYIYYMTREYSGRQPKSPSPKLAKRISEITGISIDDLLFPENGGKNVMDKD